MLDRNYYRLRRDQDSEMLMIFRGEILMEIREAIVHRFEKDRHKRSVAHMRNDALPLEKNLTDLVEGIRKVFNSTVSRGYGAFHADTTAYPFSACLSDYHVKHNGIASFTLGLQNSYQKAIDAAQLSTGVYLFFARYVENNEDFLLVVSLKLRDGTGIDNDTLSISKTINLDIDHLHEAARINLTNWSVSKETYITFVKRERGTTGKSSTDYFREFLGVTEIVESKEQTKLLIQAVQKYCEERSLDADTAREMRSRVHSYCVECTKEKKGLSLAALSMRLNDQKPDDFSAFLTESSIELGDGFEPNSSVYRSLRRYRIKDSKLTLDFEESILGSRVVWDGKTKSLTIRGLPEDIVARLDATETKTDDAA